MRRISLASIIGVLSIASLSFAQQNVTYPGSTCKPLNPSITSGFTYHPNRIINTGSQDIAVTCPLPRVYAGSNTATVLLSGANLSSCWVVSRTVFSGSVYWRAISPNVTPVNIYAPYDAVLSVTCTLSRNVWSPGGRIDGISVLFP